jgi:catabolite regulation protein CreA
MVLLAAALLWVGAAPVHAAVVGSTQTVARIADEGAEKSAAIEPMSDAAAQGAGCLVAAAATLGSIYAAGPTEVMMLATGAVIVPSSSSLLFLALYGISAAATCGMGAAATPAVLWAWEQSDAIGAQVASAFGRVLGVVTGAVQTASEAAGSELRAMTDPEKQGMGCLAAMAGATGLAMATAPSEVVMLAAGGTTIASTTPILMLGMLSTLMPASCGIGSLATAPVLALIDSVKGGKDQTAALGDDRYTSGLEPPAAPTLAAQLIGTASAE